MDETFPSSTSCRLYGVDFTSAPSRRKPITIAVGVLQGEVYRLGHVVPAHDFSTFEDFLAHPGPWVAGFDLPFGLPRDLVNHWGWPQRWSDLIRWYGQQPRSELLACFKAFCDGRPPGSKFAHRETDRPAGSSPSMRWVNPPVAWMLHAGAPRILAAGLHVPGLHSGVDAPCGRRVALETYPGFTARQVIRSSYKSDDRARQTPERSVARKLLLEALQDGGAGLSVRLACTRAWHRRMCDDASGDLMDAAICALQAGHALRLSRWGFPSRVDPVEGWIAAVPPPGLG